MKLIRSLEEVGLTTNEAKTYLALLKIGQTTTGQILKESGLNSGKIYELLENLIRKGLVSETIHDGKRTFVAAPPAQLLSFLQQKKSALNRQENHIKEVIPSLEKLRNQLIPEKTILTYTGKKGIETAALEALNSEPQGSEIISFPINDKNAGFQPFWKKWELLRLQKNITARYLLVQKGIIYNDLKDIELVDLRFLNINSPVGVDVYGESKVLILHYEDPPTCTLIYDAPTAKTFKEYFEVLWKSASS